MSAANATRFLADAMLGRLARWLRVIGVDTLQLPIETPDREIVERAARDQRVLLTRDQHLLRTLHPPRALAIRETVPLKQLREVVDAFALRRPDHLFTRCLLCNAPLEDVSAADVRELLPPDAHDLAGPIRRCPSCGRVYWRGSHVRRMEAALAAGLPEWGEDQR